MPYTLPSISGEEINEVIKTLRAGWLTSGPKTKLFETKFARYIGARHAIAVNSAQVGFGLALTAVGVGFGDEVIIPTFTSLASAYGIVRCGACPVLVDVGDDFNIKVSEVLRRITSKTRAIVPFHFAGQPAALSEILSIAQAHNLVVIEDATQGVGAVYRGKKIGTISPLTVFSFSPSGIMTTGVGGMIVTDNDEIAERVRILNKEGGFFDAKMTDIQAAIGLCQLDKLESFLKLRSHYANLYTDALRFVAEISLPQVSSDCSCSWQAYPILLNLFKLRTGRNQFILALRYENIGTAVDFTPIHLHPYFQKTGGFRFGDFPNAEWLSQRVVFLPIYPKMTQNDVNDTIAAVIRVTRRMRK